MGLFYQTPPESDKGPEQGPIGKPSDVLLAPPLGGHVSKRYAEPHALDPATKREVARGYADCATTP